MLWLYQLEASKAALLGMACGLCKYVVSGPSFHLPSRRGAVTQMRFYQHPSRWQETDCRDLEKKKIMAWVHATHAWSCNFSWDIVLSMTLWESLHPLGKVSLLEVIFL